MGSLADSRLYPRIPCRVLWMNVFLMYLLRLRSLNNLEQVSRDKEAWRAWAGGEPPSPEAIGYSFTRFDCEGLRRGLRRVAKKLGRNKVLSLGKVKGMTVVSLDGHETFSSYRRCCPECSDFCIQKVRFSP